MSEKGKRFRPTFTISTIAVALIGVILLLLLIPASFLFTIWNNAPAVPDLTAKLRENQASPLANQAIINVAPNPVIVTTPNTSTQTSIVSQTSYTTLSSTSTSILPTSSQIVKIYSFDVTFDSSVRTSDQADLARQLTMYASWLDANYYKPKMQVPLLIGYSSSSHPAGPSMQVSTGANGRISSITTSLFLPPNIWVNAKQAVFHELVHIYQFTMHNVGNSPRWYTEAVPPALLTIYQISGVGQANDPTFPTHLSEAGPSTDFFRTPGGIGMENSAALYVASRQYGYSFATPWIMLYQYRHSIFTELTAKIELLPYDSGCSETWMRSVLVDILGGATKLDGMSTSLWLTQMGFITSDDPRLQGPLVMLSWNWATSTNPNVPDQLSLSISLTRNQRPQLFTIQLLISNAITGKAIVNTYTINGVSDVRTYNYVLKNLPDAVVIRFDLHEVEPGSPKETFVRLTTLFKPNTHHFAVVNLSGFLVQQQVIVTLNGRSYSGMGYVTIPAYELPKPSATILFQYGDNGAKSKVIENVILMTDLGGEAIVIYA